MAINVLTMGLVERAIGCPFKPPPTHMKATRALYYVWCYDRCAAAIPEWESPQFLIDQPSPMLTLDNETHRTRMKHSLAELRALAKEEMVEHESA